jgi:hypothetical protein
MADWLEESGAELVVLAGYMQLLGAPFLARFPDRVINVHPALLPAFPGIRAVERAVAHGVKVFGVTVHYVDEGVDTGPIIAHWINPRSTAVTTSNAGDGLNFPLAGSDDLDAIHYIPAGSRMVGIVCKGIGEVRYFVESLDPEDFETDADLPAPGTYLQVSDATGKFCLSTNADAIDEDVAFVLANDGVSVALVIG